MEQDLAGDILLLLREAVFKLVRFTVFVSILPCLEDLSCILNIYIYLPNICIPLGIV